MGNHYLQGQLFGNSRNSMCKAFEKACIGWDRYMELPDYCT